MDDPGVVGLVAAYEHSVEAGIAVATREPRLVRECTSLGETALHLLVLGESCEAVRSILKMGADVNALCDMGSTPLDHASSVGHTEMVRTLLSAGASVAVEGQLEPTLHKAARGGHLEVVGLLLDAGASINKQADFGEAVIHIAAEEGYAPMVELLLARGADASRYPSRVRLTNCWLDMAYE